MDDECTCIGCGCSDEGEKFRRMMELSRSLGRLQGNIDA